MLRSFFMPSNIGFDTDLILFVAQVVFRALLFHPIFLHFYTFFSCRSFSDN